ncbi:sigma-70 family RNA polymerase sigma factor [Granulicella mallensis]|uniref:RNA polymerase sigma factor n=1 Tax=Granulicella mallensis (strain ATCC BAA-1857 / DSM 23137 / MP5ACTX8) TaxID=682795 RepID=G8NWW2_GRAMM|nr:sigma-70 family RNA polymerase sigma factor [Granulicella mallensis]AEU35490.1 RNA polymerase, sigma-24 subunit, ECF subfamily [Granulicella mallensis MP5ACTX8]
MIPMIQSGGESELIDVILAGNTQLYHQLILPYERSVYLISHSYMKNDKDAEDVAQETFVRAFQNLGSFRGDRKLRTWFIGIAINEAKSRLQQQAIIQTASLLKPQNEEWLMSPTLLDDWKELPSGVVEHEEIRSLLQQAFERLPDIYQRVFLLRDIEGLDLNDTAQILDMDVAQVNLTSHGARIILQSLLVPQLGAINLASKEPSSRRHSRAATNLTAKVRHCRRSVTASSDDDCD